MLRSVPIFVWLVAAPVAHAADGADRDEDRVPDDIERSHGTDPADPDTDGDGWWDGQEDLDADGELDPGETDPRHAEAPPTLFGPDGSLPFGRRHPLDAGVRGVVGLGARVSSASPTAPRLSVTGIAREIRAEAELALWDALPFEDTGFGWSVAARWVGPRPAVAEPLVQIELGMADRLAPEAEDGMQLYAAPAIGGALNLYPGFRLRGDVGVPLSQGIIGALTASLVLDVGAYRWAR